MRGDEKATILVDKKHAFATIFHSIPKAKSM